MATEDEATRAGVMQLLGAYRQLMGEGAWDQWIELWAEDGLLEFPFSPPGRQSAYRGKAEILAYMRTASGRIAVDETISIKLIPAHDPNVLVLELSTQAHTLPAGKPFNQSYVIVVETAGGKIWRFREYWNPLVSIEAFGEGWATGRYVGP